MPFRPPKTGRPGSKPPNHPHPHGGRPRPAPYGRLQSSRISRAAPNRQSATTSAIDSFELFCAYYLGITPDKRYAPANIHDVARRFGVDAGVIRQALHEHRMDPETMMNVDFDLAMAQVDIQVAPEGIDRVELAKELYAQFRSAAPRPRDWQRLLAEDARENAKTLGFAAPFCRHSSWYSPSASAGTLRRSAESRCTRA